MPRGQRQGGGAYERARAGSPRQPQARSRRSRRSRPQLRVDAVAHLSLLPFNSLTSSSNSFGSACCGELALVNWRRRGGKGRQARSRGGRAGGRVRAAALQLQARDHTSSAGRARTPAPPTPQCATCFCTSCRRSAGSCRTRRRRGASLARTKGFAPAAVRAPAARRRGACSAREATCRCVVHGPFLRAQRRRRGGKMWRVLDDIPSAGS